MPVGINTRVRDVFRCWVFLTQTTDVTARRTRPVAGHDRPQPTDRIDISVLHAWVG